MPQPSSDAHVDRVLTNISIAYMQEASNFVAGKVFPIVPSARQSDKYFTYDQADWFREEAQLRAPSTESAGSGWSLGTDTYYCDVFAVHKDIDEQIERNADAMIDLRADAARWVAGQLLMKLESKFVADYFTTGIWTGAASGNDQTGVAAAPGADQFLQWNDPASTPIEDIETLKLEMLEQTGKEPNTLLLGPKVGAALRRHPDILDRIKFTQRGVITDELIGSLLGIDRVMTAKATRNTAAEGVADSYSFYYGRNALLCYAAPAPSLMEASAGYAFAWTGYTGTSGVTGLGTGARTSVIPMPLKKSVRVEAEMTIDFKQVAADLGIFFSGAVAA